MKLSLANSHSTHCRTSIFPEAEVQHKSEGLYVVLGFVALRDGMSKAIRFFSWLAAQAVFVYIVLVAISHNPVLW